MKRFIIATILICSLTGCEKKIENDNHPIVRKIDPDLAELADKYDRLKENEEKLEELKIRVQEAEKESERLKAKQEEFRKALTNDAAMDELYESITNESGDINN